MQPANRRSTPFDSTLGSRLFGTSGIRGLANENLTTTFARKLGRTFAAYLGERGTVFVGRDVRLHSKLIQTALMQGLLEGGVDVLDCGLVPTPAMLFAMKGTTPASGVMVTGSHTPAEIAGILFFLSDTGEMDPQGESSFETLYSSEPWVRSSTGRRGTLDSKESIELYLEAIVKHVKGVGGYRVVVDPGNGATCATLGRALEALGCVVTTINGKPDGTFPARQPNPQPSTLTQLSQVMKDTKADLGVGTDSDGDRALFATNEGNVLWADLTGALFAKQELEKHDGGTVITTVNTSSMIKVLCQEYGGNLTVTKVGPPAIAEALRSVENAIFATEESGKNIWPRIILYGDAALATGKLLQIMNKDGLELGELQKTLPKFHQLKSTLECPDYLKAQAMKFAINAWKPDERLRTSTLDGLKVEYPDLAWFLVRASGTEPLLRCNAEATTSSEARELLRVATKLALVAISKAKAGG